MEDIIKKMRNNQIKLHLPTLFIINMRKFIFLKEFIY
jgi:hypothetical protein